MKKLARILVLAVAAGATILTSVATASADPRGYRGYHGHGRPVIVDRRDNSDAVVLGVIGLAAGAIVGSAIANSRARANSAPVYVEPVRPPAYYPPAPRYDDYRAPAYTRPAPVYSRPVASYGGAYQPWSAGWYDYCSDRYRSFNPSTGTYRGYDGQDHFCVAN